MIMFKDCDNDCFNPRTGYRCIYATVDVGSYSHPGTVECKYDFICPWEDDLDGDAVDDDVTID
jgi:hypothetical protein